MDALNTFEMSSLSAAFALCSITAFLAWRARSQHRPVILFLAVLALMFAFDWLMKHPTMPLKNLWLLLLMKAAFLVSPCALRLAESIGGAKVSVPWRQHIGLVLLGWLLLLPLASVIHWGIGFANTVTPVSTEYSFVIHSTMLAAVAVFLQQTVLTLKTCWWFFDRRQAQNRSLFSSVDDPGQEALRMILLAILFNAFICLGRVLYCALLDGIYLGLSVLVMVAQLTMAVFLAASLIRQLFSLKAKDEIFREKLFSRPDGARIAERKNGEGKYRNSTLREDQRVAVLQKIYGAMDEDQLFLRPGLSLQQLCEHLGESPHTVSQVINESKLTNFYDMVNRRRVLMASQMLEHEPDKSILDIAYDCGFSSKSSFNNAFKRYTETTPSRYRLCTMEKKAPLKV